MRVLLFNSGDGLIYGGRLRRSERSYTNVREAHFGVLDSQWRKDTIDLLYPNESLANQQVAEAKPRELHWSPVMREV